MNKQSFGELTKINRFKVVSILYFLILAIYLIFPSIAFADIVNPNYFTAKCNPDEVEVRCVSGRSSISGPYVDGCKKYNNNPNYRYLDGTGGTFGGNYKYCFKPLSSTDFLVFHAKSFLPILSVTILVELLVFVLFGFRNKRAIYFILIMNLITVFSLYLSTSLLFLSGIAIVLAMEALIVTFETGFLRYFLKDVSLRKIFLATFIANTTSAILGGIIISFLVNWN